ncbi:uncharacterized protein LOC126722672 isoform X1 [Quercus robur]|uniref:uncharacterized protein LOC126722672 isoform X1 n=1 Tax=Quercus robur TaxID=38942 RepID=UPI002162A1F2|nr:uncharacterized protein LOC126722672 isoform X1 [Quercus robur]XP_050281783.1 uncharacterized protein LOC126722672 isoform X1 [Quercus robur]
METRTSSSGAVSEVLKVDNYLGWSVQVKTYLIAQDLWDIVEATDECPNQEDDEAAFKAWSRKNAMALHVILISCPQRICHVISLIDSAKIAWETLKAICNIPKSRYVVSEEKEVSYVRWSNRMKEVLMYHDLWNIVEITTEPTTPNWSKKNAMALYLIRESCGSDRFSLIEKISEAEVAWATLDPDSDLKVIHLDDVDKYNEWSREVKAELLDRRQLWDIVEGTDELPNLENDAAAFKAWSKKNDLALEVIGRECRNEFDNAINKISSAKIAWDTLAAICTLPKTGFEFLAVDGNNYLDWSLQMKTILTDRQLWDIVEGTDDPPEAEKNDMALGLIRYSCFWPGLSVELKTITSAKIVWDALAAICAVPKNIVTNEKSIAAVIERLESIPAVIKRLDDVDNHGDWSLQVKTYLTDQQLWDIVERTNEPPEVENDEALVVIVFSCGYRLRFAIWGITSAKVTWDTLQEICKIPKSDYIVSEEYDYEAWSVRMEAYLRQKDLWDIDEAATEPEDAEIAFNDRSKKNAIALYLIWESSDAFFSFKKSTRTAQIAWDTLAEFGKSGGKKNSELRKYVSFTQNLRKGNWPPARQFISSCPEAKSAIIANTGSTALHIAILAGHLHIVKELVNVLPTDKLKIKDKDGNTVLGYCALVGNTEMAKCIFQKCPSLLGIGNGPSGLIPVVMALTHDSNTNAVAQCLFTATDPTYLSPGKSVNGATFFTRCIYSKAFDMACNVLEKFPNSVTALDIENESPVLALASMSFACTSGNQLIFWKRWIYNQIDQKYQLKSLHHKYKELLRRMCEVLAGLNFQQLEKGKVIEAIIIAVKQGRVEFVTEILEAFPELAWSVEESTKRNIFMLAVLYRQDEVFRFLCKSPAKNSILARVDSDSNSILHIAAMLEPSARPNKAPGAALLMQREVQWFKEVERVVHPSTLERRNKNDQTPRQLFIESHKELMKEGENWMKGVANSCTVVGALIVTIMFAAAITVPGGNKQELGLPMFLNVKVFMLFIISDALSLLFASISLLTFLCVTSSSSYKDEDFHQSLPKKMMIGISTLIISIATMMITFCASLSIILKGKSSVIIPVICLASVPVALFAWMQLRLLIDMIKLTYGSRIVDRKEKNFPLV